MRFPQDYVCHWAYLPEWPIGDDDAKEKTNADLFCRNRVIDELEIRYNQVCAESGINSRDAQYIWGLVLFMRSGDLTLVRDLQDTRTEYGTISKLKRDRASEVGS